eukprot:8288870-Alexandrium_andersonii.AAC.1
MFAEQLQQHESAIRALASDVCIDSLFGWCEDGGELGRCPHGVHPESSWQAFEWAYTMMMVTCRRS